MLHEQAGLRRRCGSWAVRPIMVPDPSAVRLTRVQSVRVIFPQVSGFA
ncbi:MAG TPA: hypothetical protein VES40_11675 [Ilumatobacteraceae bacterium]|nr:hypothetical protein [Ilumatobacteraceae bacterium]